MEWRCEWCGKPHAEDDPPCDNCGHGRFEQAVVRMGPAETDDATRPVWTCTECGRDHEKHSPPCSRCGNATLEQRQRDYSDVETTGSTGWLDVLDRRYTAGFAVVGVLALVLGLGMVGVVDLPALDIGGGPDPPEVAGNATTSTGGVSLADGEAELVATVNREREGAGLPTLERGGTLDRMATYFTRHWVRADFTDADQPTVEELEEYDPQCGDNWQIDVLPYRYLRVDGELDIVAGNFSTAAELGETLGSETGVLNDAAPVSALGGDTQYGSVGVDIHEAPNGDLYVTVVAC